MAVLSAEIQILTRKSSTPSFLAINIPPPTVTMQMGHCAPTGRELKVNKVKKSKTNKMIKTINNFNKLFLTTTYVVHGIDFL